MSRSVRLTILVIAVAAFPLPACRRPAPPPPGTGVELVPVAALPADPEDGVWNMADEFIADLLPQDLVEPRKLHPTTTAVRVRAVTDGKDVAFRLEWSDPSDDDTSDPARFSDACAVQLPAKIEPTVPAPQMGEKGRPVEMTFWTAAWQATVDGRGDSIRDLYPNAAVDHYPFQAPALEKDPAGQREMAVRYAPALALGNRMAGPRDQPVQDLIAEGPGTVHPAPPPIPAVVATEPRTAGRWSLPADYPQACRRRSVRRSPWRSGMALTKKSVLARCAPVGST